MLNQPDAMTGAAKLPKNWYVCTQDERHVVRGTAAGMVISDAANDPSLYDHNTAKLVSEQLMGLLAVSGIVTSLQIKPLPQEKLHDPQ